MANVCSIRRMHLSTLENKPLDIVKDKIQYLSIRGSKEFTLEDSPRGTEQHNHSNLQTTTTEEEVIRQKKLPSYKSSKEPVYAVVDLKHKYAQREKRNSGSELKRCNSYDSVALHTSETSGNREQNQLDHTAEDIDNIYEDGDNLFYTGLKSIEPTVADEENIYEPINVASTEASTFWKYFTRLKVSSFLQLARMRKRSQEMSSIKLAIRTPCQQSDRESQFSNIKHKFGMHRKSMQVRVSSAVSNNSNANGSSTSKKTKSRWKSVKIRPRYIDVFNSDTKADKRCFGSLPHLRRARTSLFASNHLPHLPLAKTDNDSPDPDSVKTDKTET